MLGLHTAVGFVVAVAVPSGMGWMSRPVATRAGVFDSRVPDVGGGGAHDLAPAPLAPIPNCPGGEPGGLRAARAGDFASERGGAFG